MEMGGANWMGVRTYFPLQLFGEPNLIAGRHRDGGGDERTGGGLVGWRDVERSLDASGVLCNTFQIGCRRLPYGYPVFNVSTLSLQALCNFLIPLSDVPLST